eukprot:TRINITY_DN2747_c0_g1_i15.p1 TRINITY_DN2747_c0_g1~~TRINITY_DN2747_c0_g1_i15.p1  ORF type:complete len:3200 (+),score=1304.21 TRINITY_DN2747_c0_g1_i15:431-10030(+)
MGGAASDEKVAELEARVAELEAELTEAGNSKAALAEEVASLKEAAAEAAQASGWGDDAVEGPADEKVEELEGHVATLTSELDEERAARTAAAGRATELEALLAALQEQQSLLCPMRRLGSSRRALDAQQAKIEKLKTAGRRMREERDAARQAAGLLESPSTSAQRSESQRSGWDESEGSPRRTNEEHIASLEARIAQLEAELKDALDGKATLVQEIAALHDEIAVLKEATAAADVSGWGEEPATDSAEKVSMLEARVAELEAELEAALAAESGWGDADELGDVNAAAEDRAAIAELEAQLKAAEEKTASLEAAAAESAALVARLKEGGRAVREARDAALKAVAEAEAKLAEAGAEKSRPEESGSPGWGGDWGSESPTPKEEKKDDGEGWGDDGWGSDGSLPDAPAPAKPAAVSVTPQRTVQYSPHSPMSAATPSKEADVLKIAALQKEKVALTTALAQLGAEMEAYQKEVRTARDAAAAAETKYQEAVQDLSLATHDQSAQESQVALIDEMKKKAEEEAGRMKAHCVDLEGQLAALSDTKEQLARAGAELERSKAQRVELIAQLRAAEASAAQDAVRLADAENELTALRMADTPSADAADETFVSVKARVAELETELRSASEGNAAAAQEIAALKEAAAATSPEASGWGDDTMEEPAAGVSDEKVEELEARITELEAELKAAVDSKAALAEENASLKEGVETSGWGEDPIEEPAADGASELKARIAELEAALEEATVSKAASIEKAAELEAGIAQFEADLAGAVAGKVAAAEEIATLKEAAADRQALADELDTLRTAFEAAEGAKDACSAQVAALEMEKENTAASAAALQEEMDALKQQTVEAEDGRRSLQDELASLQEALEVLRRERAEEKVLPAQPAEPSVASDDTVPLQSRIDELEAALAVAQADKETALNGLRSKASETEDASSAVEKLEAELAALRDANAALESANAELERKQQTGGSADGGKVHALQVELEAAESNLFQVQQDLQQQTLELDMAKNELALAKEVPPMAVDDDSTLSSDSESSSSAEKTMEDQLIDLRFAMEKYKAKAQFLRQKNSKLQLKTQRMEQLEERLESALGDLLIERSRNEKQAPTPAAGATPARPKAATEPSPADSDSPKSDGAGLNFEIESGSGDESMRKDDCPKLLAAAEERITQLTNELATVRAELDQARTSWAGHDATPATVSQPKSPESPVSTVPSIDLEGEVRALQNVLAGSANLAEEVDEHLAGVTANGHPDTTQAWLDDANVPRSHASSGSVSAVEPIDAHLDMLDDEIREMQVYFADSTIRDADFEAETERLIKTHGLAIGDVNLVGSLSAALESGKGEPPSPAPLHHPSVMSMAPVTPTGETADGSESPVAPGPVPVDQMLAERYKEELDATWQQLQAEKAKCAELAKTANAALRLPDLEAELEKVRAALAAEQAKVVELQIRSVATTPEQKHLDAEDDEPPASPAAQLHLCRVEMAAMKEKYQEEYRRAEELVLQESLLEDRVQRLMTEAAAQQRAAEETHGEDRRRIVDLHAALAAADVKQKHLQQSLEDVKAKLAAALTEQTAVKRRLENLDALERDNSRLKAEVDALQQAASQHPTHETADTAARDAAPSEDAAAEAPAAKTITLIPSAAAEAELSAALAEASRLRMREQELEEELGLMRGELTCLTVGKNSDAKAIQTLNTQVVAAREVEVRLRDTISALDSEIEQLKTTATAASDDHEASKSDLAKATSERDSWRSEAEEFDEKAKLAERAARRAEADEAQAKNELTTAQKKAELQEETIESLRAENRALLASKSGDTEAITRLNAEVLTGSDTTATLQLRVVELEASEQEWKAQALARGAGGVNTSPRNTPRPSPRRAPDDDLTSDAPITSARDLATIEERCRGYQEKLRAAREECATQSKKFTEQIRLANERAQELQTKNVALESSASEAAGARITLETAARIKTEEVRDLEEQVALLREDIYRLEQEVDARHGVAKKRQVAIHQLEAVVKGSKAEAAALAATLRGAENRAAQLGKAHAALQATHRSHTIELEDARHQLVARQSEVDRKAEEVQAWRLRSKELEGSVRTKATEVRSLKEHLHESRRLQRLMEKRDESEEWLTREQLKANLQNVTTDLQEALDTLEAKKEVIAEQEAVAAANAARIAELEREGGTSSAAILQLQGLLRVEEAARETHLQGEYAQHHRVHEAKIHALLDEKITLEGEARAAKHQVEELSARWAELEKSQKEAMEQLSARDAEKRALQSQLAARTSALATSEATLESLRRELDVVSVSGTAAASSSSAEALKKNFASRLHVLESSSSELRRSLVKTEAEKAAAEADRDRLRLQLGKSEAEFAAALAQREEAAEASRQRITKLLDAHHEDVHLLSSIRGELESKDKARQDLKTEVNALQIQLDNATKGSKAATKRCESLQKQLDKAAREHSAIIEKNKRLTADLKEAVEDLWRAERLKAQAEQDAETIRASLHNEARLRKEARGTADVLVGQNQKLKRELAVVDTQMKEAQRRNQRLLDEVQIRSKQRKAAAAAGTLDRDGGATPAETKSFLAKIKSLEGQLDDAQRKQARSGARGGLNADGVWSPAADKRAVAHDAGAVVYDTPAQVQWFSERLLLKAEVDGAARKIRALDMRVKELTGELRESDVLVSDAEERARNAQEEVVTLRAQLEKALDEQRFHQHAVQAQQHSPSASPRSLDSRLLSPITPADVTAHPASLQAWQDLLTSEEERLKEILSSTADAAQRQANVCLALRTAQSKLDSRLSRIVPAAKLYEPAHCTQITGLHAEVKAATTKIRVAEDNLRKVQDVVAHHFEEYKQSFTGHLRSLRLCTSPWADPIGRELIQQHRGKWCGAAQHVADLIGTDLREMEGLAQRFRIWESTLLEDADAVGMAAAGRDDALGVAGIDLADLEKTDLLPSADDYSRADGKLAKLRAENEQLEVHIMDLREKVDSLEAELEIERSPPPSPAKRLEVEPLFRCCVRQLQVLQGKYSFLLAVRDTLAVSLQPLPLPPARHHGAALFRRAATVVLGCLTLRRRSQEARRDASAATSDPMGVLKEYMARFPMAGQNGHPLEGAAVPAVPYMRSLPVLPPPQIPHVSPPPTGRSTRQEPRKATSDVIQGLMQLKDTIATSKARVGTYQYAYDDRRGALDDTTDTDTLDSCTTVTEVEEQLGTTSHRPTDLLPSHDNTTVTSLSEDEDFFD